MATPVPAATVRQRTELTAAGAERVLIVEDDEAVRAIAQRTLEIWDTA